MADLFALRANDLKKIERFAEVSAANLVAAIDKARHPTLARFINALGIPGVGAQTARDLADRFGTLRAIRSAGESALAAAPGVGPAAARAIRASARP